MRDNDLEKMIEQLPNRESEQILRGHMAELKRFAGSEEGKRLVGGLGQNGGHAVMQAAEGLKNGDTESLKTLIRDLQSDKDGKLLAQKISKMLGRGQ